MPKRKEAFDEEVSEEVNPNDPEARKIREDAVDYADRVARGEEPWADDSEDWPENPDEVAVSPDKDAPEVPDEA